MTKRKPSLSHVDRSGRARMVDVSAKAPTARQAVAKGHITLSAAARTAIRAKRLKKGDPLAAARLAGVMAAKRTSELIPLCHPLALTHVDVELDAVKDGYAITATVRTTGPTGVEMEALTAVAVAALTIYDMVKAVDQRMTIGRIHLTEKTGGKRDFKRP
jgi:cyclic pyranopterin phosphate synthase